MKKYLFILLSLLSAFVVVQYSNNNIFISGTPKINPFYLTKLENQFKKGINSVYLAFSVFNIGKNKTDNNLANINSRDSSKNNTKLELSSIPDILFKPLSKGVSAYEKEDKSVILRIDKGTNYKVSQITLPDGRVINIIDLTGQ